MGATLPNSEETIRFDGKVALVTGAGRGLGRAYALEFARRGAKVVVNDANLDLTGAEAGDKSPADEVVDEIVALGGEAIAHVGNVAVKADAEGMVQAALDAFGGIDIVVCNAGQMHKLCFSEASAEDVVAHFSVHVLGSFLVSRAAWPHMVEKGAGRIVLTTSQVGLYGQFDAAAYGAAKMGVMGLLQAMKLESRQHGIHVNAIAPFALTRMGEGAFPESMRPFIQPSLVAPAVAWLASDACDWNGEVLVAGGGHFARARPFESQGIDFDNPDDITIEALDGRIGEIADMTDALMPDDALGAVGKTFERLGKLAGL